MKKLAALFVTFGITFSSYGGALDTWTNVDTAFGGEITRIVYGNGQFMAPLQNPLPFAGGLSRSSDGIHWVNSFGANRIITGITFAHGLCVESESGEHADAGDIIYTDGTNTGIFLGSSPSLCGLADVTYGNGIFVAVGYEFELGGYGISCISSNGSNWSAEIQIKDTFYPNTNFYPTGIASGDGGFLVVGNNYWNYTNGFIYYSSDGKNWEDFSPGIPGTYMGITHVNGIFYLSVYYSQNGTSFTNYYAATNIFAAWTQISPPIPQLYLPSSGSNSLYLSVGSAGAVYSSTNRSNWVLHTTGITNDLTAIAYGNGRFVAVGTKGGIFASGLTSPSLVAQNQSPFGVQLTISGGLGPTYQLQASTNLTSWTNIAIFTNIGVSAQFVDTTATNLAQRYYRTVSP